MRGHDLGDLVLGEAGRKMLGRCKVADLALVAGERLVGDMAHEVLQEAVLTVLGRARVCLQRQDLLAHQRDEQRLDVLFRPAGQVGEGRAGEGLAENSAVLEHAPLVRREPIEPRGDQGVQRLRNVQLLGRARRPVDRALLHQQCAVEQHAHRLDRVERHALGASEDLTPKRARQPGHEAGEQFLHRLLGERLEEERREVAVTRAPGRAPLEQLGARQRDDVEGVVSRPFEQVFDEVEQGAVRPLHVLEGEHGRVLVRQALEEEPPGREEVLPVACLVLAQPQQLSQSRLDIAPLLLVEDVCVERRAQLAPGGRGVLVLDDAAAHAHHVRECPVGDALAVSETAAAVPVDRVDDAVEVLVELPRQPRLADASHAGH